MCGATREAIVLAGSRRKRSLNQDLMAGSSKAGGLFQSCFHGAAVIHQALAAREGHDLNPDIAQFCDCFDNELQAAL